MWGSLQRIHLRAVFAILLAFEAYSHPQAVGAPRPQISGDPPLCGTEDLEYSVERNGELYWISIRIRNGIELAGVSFDPYVGHEDYSTQRFFGMSAEDMLGFMGPGNPALLEDPRTEQAANLWWTGFAGISACNFLPRERAILHRQSQLLYMLLQMTGAAQAALDPNSWIPNGCTGVPDFDFGYCCDAHDICYCAGGTEADRKECDLQLKDCIRDSGHPFLAIIYYAGVRLLGGPYFIYEH